MKNLLLDTLRNNGSKNSDLFNCNGTVISYKTGIPPLDYYLGYKVNVYNKDDELIDSYPEIGIPAGSMVTFIGKPSTSKTSTAVTIAANIVRNFDNGLVIHFDLEQSMNMTRIATLARMKMSEIANKYILRQERTTLEDMKSTIISLYMEKTRNPETYKYKTGKLNEFGEEIEIFEPTVIIIDSIATITMGLNENDKKELAKLEEIGTQTDRMRLTGEIGRFFNEILPYLRTANIILLSINQIKTNPNMGIVKSPAEILYLAQDEALPGGKAPQFNASILIKFVAIGSEKYTLEDNGFDGFGTRAMIIKCRSNQAGQSVDLVYDKKRGVDAMRTTLAYAKQMGLLGGNKNSTYFVDSKDVKWSMVHLHEEIRERPELIKHIFANTIPLLEKRLSTITDEEKEIFSDEFDY